MGVAKSWPSRFGLKYLASLGGNEVWNKDLENYEFIYNNRPEWMNALHCCASFIKSAKKKWKSPSYISWGDFLLLNSQSDSRSGFFYILFFAISTHSALWPHPPQHSIVN